MAPFSIFSEQLRAIQTGLFLGAPHADHRVLAITAARPGEGKTTLTIALARALAMSGVRVVAVDCDVRQPSFDPVFQIGGAEGLTDYLAGLASLDQIVCRDAESSLAVIGTGTQSGNALPMFLSSALPEFLEALRDRYDVVLLDVPPTFALAEGRVVAQVADGALLCVRWGRTPQRVVMAAVTLLQESGVDLVGTILTRVNSAAHRNSGYADSEVYQPRYNGYFR
jgi:capsular exopolysaccharide synthesis family protein